jgi:hypothetical protein
MGAADQSPLRLGFLKASQVESSKTQVVFHIPECALGFNAARLSQADALLGEQVLSSLSSVFPELEADLDAAIAFCFGTLGFERTGRAVVTLIVTAVRAVTILATIGAGLAVSQRTIGWTGEGIPLRVIIETRLLLPSGSLHIFRVHSDFIMTFACRNKRWR